MTRIRSSRQETLNLPEDEAQLSFDFNPPDPALPQLWTPNDIFINLSEETIRSFKEDGRVERKKAQVSQKDLSEYVSMWANTQPFGGLVFIGVSNSGKILGCRTTEQEHINDLEAVRRLCPDARLGFKRIAVENQKCEKDFVIALRVYYRDDKLVETVHGEAFIREGEEKRRLTETEKREIRLNKGELDVESEPVSLIFPDDFDTSLIKEFREKYIKTRKLQKRYNNQEILQLAQLGRKTADGFKPNLACALLFAKNNRTVVPGALIRIIRYDGTEEKFGQSQNVLFDEIVDGPLSLQIAEAKNKISSQVRSFIRLRPEGRFANNPEFPETVWLEAVVNAVVHRSYNLKNMNIFVKMFEDKMVIESPGAFLPPTTAETVYDAHNPRNPHLMWAMYYLDYVQCAYEVTRRMREDMRKAGLPDPIFKQQEVGTFKVIVTLENDVEHRKVFVRSEASAAVNPDVYASLTESEKLIVNYLVDQKTVNVTDATLIIGSDWRKTKTVLETLEKKNVIERKPGKPRSRHRFYYLKSRPPASK